MQAGADGLELDVHLSADGVPVVHHDATLDRTTSASGPVAARTAAELARVDAGCRFAAGGAFPFRNQGIGVPTLAEVLRRYPDVPVIVEMKVDSAEMGEAVAREVRARGCRRARLCRRLRRAQRRSGAGGAARDGVAAPATRRCGWPSIERGRGGPFGARRTADTRCRS